VWAQYAQGWRTGLAPTLWTAVVASLAVFAVAAAAWRAAWRLAPLLLPYLILLALAAIVWHSAPERPLAGSAPATWIRLHIVFSVLTYAVLTICAIAGLAAFLQERALKGKRRGTLVQLLPSLSDAEGLELRLLGVSAVILGLGVVTGMATQFFETGMLLVFDHKTLLSLATFAVILGLLAARRRQGLRGRRAARLVLVAYLLLTLAYPGVKFVTDVLMA
jgi:ABC-type uncharacterized transport system permease subunit